MTFIKNISSAYAFDGKDGDQGTALVENVLLMIGFIFVTLAVVNLVGGAIKAKAQDVSNCIASANSYDQSTQANTDTQCQSNAHSSAFANSADGPNGSRYGN